MNNLRNKIIESYSKVQTPILYTDGEEISFEGSQKQKEFFTAWDTICNYYSNNPNNELTFLEIGAWKGLWGIAFAEFCTLNNIKGKYITVTMLDNDSNNSYLHSSLQYIESLGLETLLIDENSLSEQALNSVLDFNKEFNIVYIDADHSYLSVMSDIKNFAPLSKDILIFHDIRPTNSDVYNAITDSNISLDKEICFGDNGMGIGIKYTNKK
jgi:hypothetical protein